MKSEGKYCMKKKLVIYGMLIAAVLLVGICFLAFHNKTDCSSVELREEYLRQLGTLQNVSIGTEIMIDDNIISGYTSANGSYGIAIFEPSHGDNYKFRINYNSTENEILTASLLINNVPYDLFWANKADLDVAQITYYTTEGSQEYELDASNNKILYLQSPEKNYTVSAVFVTVEGEYYN